MGLRTCGGRGGEGAHSARAVWHPHTVRPLSCPHAPASPAHLQLAGRLHGALGFVEAQHAGVPGQPAVLRHTPRSALALGGHVAARGSA